jgi:hypothetical protein
MREIKLWKNRKELSDKVALVDAEDYNRVVTAISNRAKWYAHSPPTTKKYYAMNGNRDLSIHRVVMNAPKGMDVDHINGDPLDNRKENLRICTRSQNSQNKQVRTDSASGHKGVYERKGGKLKKRFQAYIWHPEKKARYRLGYYATAEEAATAYDRKALELFGEFALLNFPENNY